MKFKICILVVFHLCFVTANAQKLYDKAYDEYFNGDYGKSAELFKQCIRNGEDTLHAYLYLASANTYLGHYDDAMVDLNIVNRIDSTTYELHYRYGNLFMFMNDYTKAIANYDSELARYPNEIGCYEERANVKAGSGDYDGAFADYAKAIKIDPQDPLPYSDRGFILLHLNRYTEAINDLNTSLEIKPTQKAFTNRGMVHYLTDSNKLAISDYTNALKLLPDDGETLYLRGISYNKMNLRDKACADFKRSLSLGYKGAKEMIDELHCN